MMTNEEMEAILTLKGFGLYINLTRHHASPLFVMANIAAVLPRKAFSSKWTHIYMYPSDRGFSGASAISVAEATPVPWSRLGTSYLENVFEVVGRYTD
jgi:hypothetical protein